ncbi:hypothetical protein B4U79_00414, partial [Dinothrombium tinctorium]
CRRFIARNPGLRVEIQNTISTSHLESFEDVFKSLNYITNLSNKLFRRDKFVDIIFIVENEKIAAHRSILAASSLFFRGILFGHISESKMSEIVLNETPKRAFKAIIHFIYNGSLDTKQMNAEDVLALISLSHEYHLIDLTDLVIFELQAEDIIYKNVGKVFA